MTQNMLLFLGALNAARDARAVGKHAVAAELLASAKYWLGEAEKAWARNQEDTVG